MFSRCRTVDRIAIALLILGSLAACERERRDVDPRVQASTEPTMPISTLNPGEVSTAPLHTSNGATFEKNAYHINEGQRLYRWFNCTGCHANGGGDIGPALMDDEWRYGGEIEQIHASIAQGRPNGMPTFRDKIPDAQIWQIAAYVRSLSGNTPKAATPSRGETISATPPLTRTPEQPPKAAASPADQQPPP
jgi:cytochrome c oxidase cbb3-type subunit 3